MKKAIIAVVLAVCTLGAVSAQEDDKSFIGLDVFGGATFEILDSWGDTSNDTFEDGLTTVGQMFTALRVGGGADLNFRLLDFLSVGAEAGLFFFATEGSDGTTTFSPLVDIPVRATVRLSAGGFGLQVFGGYNFSTTFDALASATNYLDINHKLEVGARGYLGIFYVEYSRLFWTDDINAVALGEGSHRIGMGLNFELF